jgi:hypothetical protein
MEEITLEQFKAQFSESTGKANAYAWPGGYPLYYLLHDGEVFCADCATTERKLIEDSIANHLSDGWRVVAVDVNWEDDEMYCANCNAHIESAYGKPNTTPNE